MAATEMKVLLSAKEYVLIALTLTLAPIVLLELYGVTQMRATIPEFQTNPDMPHISEWLIGIGFAFVIIGLRFVFLKIAKPIGRNVLSPTKRIHADRVERFATVLFKFMYFSVITVAGYYIMRDEKWFPPVLGGKGAIREALLNLHEAPGISLKYYYFVQLGYHFHSLLYMLFFSPIRNDFIEMLLHHLVTIILIGGSYLANYCAMGALTAFTHDIGDVTGYAIKSVVDTGNTPLIVAMYFVLLVSWAYTRLYVYPVHLIYNAIYVIPEVSPHVTGIFLHPGNALLCMLLVLHVYWYGLFLVMGYTLVRKGLVEDIQDKCSDVKEIHKEDEKTMPEPTTANTSSKTKNE
ncbi:longevity-assurance family protein [Plasmopara halstedii]|uniref:Longevity-assurance family protein n=1 Tax=Plasmopara halstedii TaxID=4781 RepID=A0A0P1B6N9_PLAHL|nr:longevity-assurance family protein [Plasmopara halstedii]CEG49741.1 longevity-assurance family protein [Plasmopara halstedii]|eukprot:XP_024586110.1 longevity-assurance family protein [Plasmopara halstedii]